MEKKPNILLLLNDHQAYYRHGWDGGVSPLVPNFDQMAAEGMLFGRTYCPTALCVPARRSILIGLYPHNHGLMTNDESLPEKDANLFIRPLAEAGYKIFYFGKWHNGDLHLWRDGCEGFTMPGYGQPYQSREYEDYCDRLRIPIARCYLKHSLDYKEPLERECSAKDIDFYRDKSIGLTLTPEESHEAYFLAFLACEKLRELQGGVEPWCMVVSFWGPHRPFLPTKGFADLYNPNEIEEYPNFRVDLSQKPQSHLFEHNNALGDSNGNMIQPSALSWSDWQQQLALCYAHTTLVDAAGGRILNTLNDLALEKDTVIFWTTDHGDAIASHGGHGTKGPSMTEEIYRVPFAVKWSGVIEPRQISNALVSSIDLAPTFLDIAGTGFERGPDGETLLPILQHRSRKVRDELCCEFNGLGGDLMSRYGKPEYRARAIVGERFKYVATEQDMDELYDLVDDPYQKENLIGKEEFRSLIIELRQKLSLWQARTGDEIQVL